MGLASAPLFSASSASIATGSNLFNARRLFHPHGHQHCSWGSTIACSRLHCFKFSHFNPWRSTSSFREDTACKVLCKQVKVEDDKNDEACELVSGMELSMGEGADSVNGYLLNAVKNNNGTGILLLSDVFGFEDSSTRDFAYRVACNGYNVVVPDMFRGDPWGENRPKALFEQWLAKQSLQRVLKDIHTTAEWMADEFVAAGISKKLGIIGFCYGGGRVIDVLAQDKGACFGTGVSFYGTRIDPSAAVNVKVPVLFIAGDADPLCPLGALTGIGRSTGKGSKLVVYEGRGHGFAHRPESPEEDADAEEAFNAMRNWLHDGLAVGS